MFPNKGEVLAFKTDTVWGFGCDPLDFEAVEKIYEIKKRDSKKPLILMSSDFKYLEKYIQNIPPYAELLIQKYLPGALTLIFEKSPICPDNVTRGSATVGVRIPDSRDFREIIQKTTSKVLATTSCNVSGENPVQNYAQALKNFGNIANVIKPFDDTINDNIPSSVILCKAKNFEILRQGAIIINEDSYGKD